MYSFGLSPSRHTTIIPSPPLSSSIGSPHSASSHLSDDCITTLDPLPSDIVDIIFGHLEDQIPLRIARLSQSCYASVVKKLYRDVVVSKHNASKVFYGMCVDHTAELPYPYGGFVFESRKAKAFRHTRRVTFEDIWAAEAMVMAAREYPTHEYGFMANENAYPLLFPAVEHVLLGKNLLLALPDASRDVNVAEQSRWRATHTLTADDPHRAWLKARFGHWYVTAGEFEDLLFRMARPEVTCCDMLYVDESRGDSNSGSRTLDSLSLYHPSGIVCVHWFFWSAEEQRPLMGEFAIGIPIRIVFHTTPPPDEVITEEEIVEGVARLAEMDEDELAREMALAIAMLVEEFCNFSDIINDSEMPSEEEADRCTIEFCLPNAELVRKRWREHEDRNVGAGAEEYCDAWEGVFKFTDLEDMRGCEACGRK
ncbi:hypothetical protein IAT38_002184 [Cryptococcus sp. DSM 104549]